MGLRKYARAKNAYFSVKHIWINKKNQIKNYKNRWIFKAKPKKHKMFKNFKFYFSKD